MTLRGAQFTDRADLTRRRLASDLGAIGDHADDELPRVGRVLGDEVRGHRPISLLEDLERQWQVREEHRVEREERQSHRRHPRTRLISPQARSALRVGYLLKDRVADADELLGAARRVAGGGSAIDPAVIDEVVRSRATQERLAVLTARE